MNNANILSNRLSLVCTQLQDELRKLASQPFDQNTGASEVRNLMANLAALQPCNQDAERFVSAAGVFWKDVAKVLSLDDHSAKSQFALSNNSVEFLSAAAEDAVHMDHPTPFEYVECRYFNPRTEGPSLDNMFQEELERVYDAYVKLLVGEKRSVTERTAHRDRMLVTAERRLTDIILMLQSWNRALIKRSNPWIRHNRELTTLQAFAAVLWRSEAEEPASLRLFDTPELNHRGMAQYSWFDRDSTGAGNSWVEWNDFVPAALTALKNAIIRTLLQCLALSMVSASLPPLSTRGDLKHAVRILQLTLATIFDIWVDSLHGEYSTEFGN